MKTAVLYAPNQPLVVQDAELDPLQAGEVLVRIAATGVCHSDYHVLKGDWEHPMPCVLGHEAAGFVEAVGPAVTTVRLGQRVVLCFRPYCGRCFYCVTGRPVLCEGRSHPNGTLIDGTTRLRIGGQPVYHFANTASFAEYAIVAEEQVIPMRDDVPMPVAALIGCAVMTGVGAVLNTARVEAGSTVVVIGAGGVGLNVVQGARLAGANRIIAVDVVDKKLDFALEMGATHAVHGTKENVIARVRELTGGRGADYAFEAIGQAPTMRQAFRAVGAGGTVVVVGMAPDGVDLSVNALALAFGEKTIKGCFYGSTRPPVDMPKLMDLYLAGKLQLDKLVTQTYSLDEINEGFRLLREGAVARGVVCF